MKQLLIFDLALIAVMRARDVRSSIANGGKPDMARTAHFGGDWPSSD
jgi:hypothetical protein